MLPNRATHHKFRVQSIIYYGAFCKNIFNKFQALVIFAKKPDDRCLTTLYVTDVLMNPVIIKRLPHDCSALFSTVNYPGTFFKSSGIYFSQCLLASFHQIVRFTSCRSYSLRIHTASIFGKNSIFDGDISEISNNSEIFREIVFHNASVLILLINLVFPSLTAHR